MILMGLIKYFFYLYGFIFFSRNLLVRVIWFLIACIAVVRWFNLSKGLLLSLLYLGGFMVLFIYIISVDTKILKNTVIGFSFILICLYFFYIGHFFHENFSFLLLMYINKCFVFILLFQLFYLLFFISEELLPIKSIRILY
jgi:hypothetical protein